ncbi:MAG: hypothetical protein AAF483_24285 [Planctomycetota bacterium]
MNPDHVACIWVEGEGADYKDPKFATGYPIAPGLILTVGHIFKDNWTRVTIQIPKIANSAKSNNRGENDVPLAWCGLSSESGLDAALIKCNLPAEVRDRTRLLEARPTSPMKWFGYGFPEFVRPEKKPGAPFDSRGDFSPPQDGAVFELECSEEYLNPEKWGGASGGPIFLSDSQVLAGIFHGVRHHGGEITRNGQHIKPIQRILGTPAWKIFADEKFQLVYQQALEPEAKEFTNKDEKWFSSLASRIARAFPANQRDDWADLFQEVFDETPAAEAKEFKLQIQRIVRQKAANRFLAADIVDLRERCNEFGLNDQANRLDQMLTSVIPTMLTPEERRKLTELLDESGVVQIEVSCPAGAAIKIAAYGRRALDDDSIRSWPDNPMNWTGPNGQNLRFVLPGAPGVDQIAARIFHELSKEMLGSEESHENEAIRNSIASESTLPSAADVEQAVEYCEDQKGFVNNRFKQRERRRGFSFCVYSAAKLLEKNSSDASRKSLEVAIEKVQSWLPALRFMEIAHNNPPEEEGFAVEQLSQLHEDRHKNQA